MTRKLAIIKAFVQEGYFKEEVNRLEKKKFNRKVRKSKVSADSLSEKERWVMENNMLITENWTTKQLKFYIDDNLDALRWAKWFLTLDCNMPHHQVPLEEEDKPKPVFPLRWEVLPIYFHDFWLLCRDSGISKDSWTSTGSFKVAHSCSVFRWHSSVWLFVWGSLK